MLGIARQALSTHAAALDLGFLTAFCAKSVRSVPLEKRPRLSNGSKMVGADDTLDRKRTQVDRLDGGPVVFLLPVRDHCRKSRSVVAMPEQDKTVCVNLAGLGLRQTEQR